MTSHELFGNWHAIDSAAGRAVIDIAAIGVTTVNPFRDAIPSFASVMALAGMSQLPVIHDSPRRVITSQWDGHKPPHNKAALKAAKKLKAAMRRAGKR